jgi:hypothetical protein
MRTLSMMIEAHKLSRDLPGVFQEPFNHAWRQKMRGLPIMNNALSRI